MRLVKIVKVQHVEVKNQTDITPNPPKQAQVYMSVVCINMAAFILRNETTSSGDGPTDISGNNGTTSKAGC